MKGRGVQVRVQGGGDVHRNQLGIEWAGRWTGRLVVAIVVAIVKLSDCRDATGRRVERMETGIGRVGKDRPVQSRQRQADRMRD